MAMTNTSEYSCNSSTDDLDSPTSNSDSTSARSSSPEPDGHVQEDSDFDVEETAELLRKIAQSEPGDVTANAGLFGNASMNIGDMLTQLIAPDVAMVSVEVAVVSVDKPHTSLIPQNGSYFAEMLTQLIVPDVAMASLKVEKPRTPLTAQNDLCEDLEDYDQVCNYCQAEPRYKKLPYGNKCSKNLGHHLKVFGKHPSVPSIMGDFQSFLNIHERRKKCKESSPSEASANDRCRCPRCNVIAMVEDAQVSENLVNLRSFMPQLYHRDFGADVASRIQSGYSLSICLSEALSSLVKVTQVNRSVQKKPY